MKHFNKLVLAVFLLPSFSNAQSNYKPGYVVTLKGDTLHGFIDYREWDKTPKNISFKNFGTNKQTENFTTKNTLAFAISDLEYYERHVVQVSQDPTDINKLAAKPDTSAITDTVFLRISTKGKYLTLYNYTDNIKLRFYLLEAGQSWPQELAYHAFYNADISSSIQYVTRYRTQLENLAQKYNADNSAEQERILRSDYREPELVKIVQGINGNSSVQFTPQGNSGIRWFAGIGINSSNLNFQGNGIGFSGNYSSFFPKITAGIDFLVNKNTQSIVLRADYSFTINKYNASSTDNSTLTPSTSSLNFTQYNSSVTPQIIFNIYNTEKLKLFVDVGASLNISMYNHYQYVITNGSFASSVQDNFPAFQHLWVSFPIKAGVAINKKIEVNVCYIPSSLIASYSTFSGAITAYQAGVNYLFGK